MLEDWTSSRRIGRRIDIKLRAIGSGIEPRRAKIAPKKSELWRSTSRLGNRSQEKTIHQRIGRSVDEPMTCQTIFDSSFLIIIKIKVDFKCVGLAMIAMKA